jgi:UDP-3-O-acyl N-acetylglucosamine deacetylase
VPSSSYPVRRLRDSAEFSGVGVHSGEPCRVRVGPGETGGGCWIRQSGERFRLGVDAVLDLERCTVIGQGRARLSTVEHLFAALAALGVYDCEISAEGGEVPILDGSAEPFYQALRPLASEAGTCSPLELKQPVWVGNEHSQVLALPSSVCELRYCLFYPHPLLGYQEVSFCPQSDDFGQQLAAARTFALEQEVEWLKAKGLARGGSLDNALVVGRDGYSSALRWPDEPVRHKCLDLLGDLYLLGRPLQAQVLAVKAGHRWHVGLAQKLHELAVAGQHA